MQTVPCSNHVLVNRKHLRLGGQAMGRERPSPFENDETETKQKFSGERFAPERPAKRYKAVTDTSLAREKTLYK